MNSWILKSKELSPKSKPGFAVKSFRRAVFVVKRTLIFVINHRLMKYLVIGLLILFSTRSEAQVVNSMSPDKTGMYFYALDSVATLIAGQRKVDRLILRADWQIIRDFPDTLHGMKIVKEEGKETKVKKLTATDVVVKITSLSIIRDQVSFSMQTLERRGKTLGFSGDVIYIFLFKYRPESGTYSLSNLRKGFHQ